jgi:diketogulonate reductase-like aldo/keto reductase
MDDPRILTARGVTVPRLGFGTWQITGEDCVDAVRNALDLGYRHIDTARAYGNEAEVGRGIAEAGLPREDFFVTTKVWMDDLAPGRVRASAEASLNDLNLDRVDLLLIHWPSEDVPLEDTLAAMTEVQQDGLTTLIGVSNFPPGLLYQALDYAPIACNQVEFHPFLAQEELLDVAANHDLFLAAYSPLGHGKVPKDPTLQEIGEAHGKTAGQVALRWLLDQPRVAVLPKAATPERRQENLGVFDFELSDSEHRKIARLPKDQRETDPAWAPDWAA